MTARDKAERAVRLRVDQAKTALGERGPPWWRDGSPDFNSDVVEDTDYAAY